MESTPSCAFHGNISRRVESGVASSLPTTSATKAPRNYDSPCPTSQISLKRKESKEKDGENSPSVPSASPSFQGSPSHGSQDSGYSDSADSSPANSDSCSPQVRHITCVYFNESLRSTDWGSNAEMTESSKTKDERPSSVNGLDPNEEFRQEMEHKKVPAAHVKGTREQHSRYALRKQRRQCKGRRRWSLDVPNGLVDQQRNTFCKPSSKVKSCEVVHENRLREWTQKNNPTDLWMSELRSLYEAECMNTLQSKSLHCIQRSPSSGYTAEKLASVRDVVWRIQEKSRLISTDFVRLCQQLEYVPQEWPSSSNALTGRIQAFLTETSRDGLCDQVSLSRQKQVVEEICKSLADLCDPSQYFSRSSSASKQIVQVLSALGHAVTKYVDLRVSLEIKALIEALKKEAQLSQMAVSQLIALGVDGSHICRLIGKLGGVRALLALCLQTDSWHLRVASLRAIAIACCVDEGIADLESVSGVNSLLDILVDSVASEEERSEAAGVLAQVTSPWIENHTQIPVLHQRLCEMVRALTDLAKNTSSAEKFLLVCAALANLTFGEGGCLIAMQQASTAATLIRRARENQLELPVFTKDQIATVLAHLSGNRTSATEISDSFGVPLLVHFLYTSPSKNLQEESAVERVQQKSAIALSRLCNNSDISRQVLDSGGADRLVTLCKNEQLRNNSDAVLIACLAALRKMSTACSKEEIEKIRASELLEPRLLDSFLMYSSKQESYV